MPHGAPDWSNIVKQQQVHRLDDMAELAARLHSIHIWDRRGDVIFLESFENGLARWNTRISGAGASIEITTERCDSYGFSVKMIAGSDEDRLAAIYHAHPIPEIYSFGWEFCFTHHDWLEYIELEGRQYLLGEAYYYCLRWNPGGKSLQYRDETWAWRDIITNIELSPDDRLFHHMKLACNFKEYRYERAILDNYTVNLVDKYPFHFIYPYQPAVGLWIRLYSKSGYNAKSYVDSIIFTINEPVG